MGRELQPCRLRSQDAAFYLSVAFIVGVLAAALNGHQGWAIGLGAGAVAATVSAKWLSRRRPAPLPYAQRWMLELTRPFFPSWAIRKAVAPSPMAHVLEVGPGTGRHAVGIASLLGSDGRLDVVDVQRSMLDAVLERARRRGVTNVHATETDARALPWSDSEFDAAYLVTVLGEVPERASALSELHRVIRPNGCLVVGEMILDPDYIPIRALKREAAEAGFLFDGAAHPPLAYIARFRRP